MKPDPIRAHDKALKRALNICAQASLSPSELERAKQRVTSVSEKLRRHGLESSCLAIAKYFLSTEGRASWDLTPVFPVSEFLVCGSKGFTETLEFGIRKGIPHFAALPADKLLHSVTSSALLNKLQSSRAALLRESIEVLRCCLSLGNPLPAGSEWVVQKAKVTELAGLVPALLKSSERNILGILLGRDTSCKLFIKSLESCNEKKDRILFLSEIISEHPKATVNFLRKLPTVLSGTYGNQAVDVLKAWLECLGRISEDQRLLVSGTLASMCGKLLSKHRRTTREQSALNQIGLKMRDVAFGGSPDLRGFWAVFPVVHGATAPTVQVHVSRDAAQLIVEIEEKLKDSRYSAVEVFKSLAVNLGIEPFLAKGDQVVYDFTIHRDVDGGLVSGSAAIVVDCGWKHGDTILKKAPVKSISLS